MGRVQVRRARHRAHGGARDSRMRPVTLRAWPRGLSAKLSGLTNAEATWLGAWAATSCRPMRSHRAGVEVLADRRVAAPTPSLPSAGSGTCGVDER